jgi:hypothetical protein
MFLLLGFSLTNIIVFLHVFSWFRKLICGISDYVFYYRAQNNKLIGFRKSFLGRMIHCHACTGFWVGCLLSCWMRESILISMKSNSLIELAIVNGILMSGFNFIVWVVLRKLGAEEL